MGTGGRHCTSVLAAIACVLLVPTGTAHAQAADCPHADIAVTADTLALVEDALYCLLDSERSKRGFLPLHVDQRLESAAFRHSQDMIQRDYFSHHSPGGHGPKQRLQATGYLRRSVAFGAGENLGWGTGLYASARAVMASWLQSPSHARIVNDSRYRDVGVAYALGLPSSLGRHPTGAVVTAEFAFVRRALRSARKRPAR